MKSLITKVLIVTLFLLGDAWSIRSVRLVVDPPVVARNGTASLRCERDLEGMPLYSVKWYRGSHEFYRYSPSEQPKTRNFEVPGIFVDMQRSNSRQVTLHHMGLTLAGNFSCEVTADSPYYSTSTVHKYIDIIALPEHSPTLIAQEPLYQPGQLLRANCTSSPSRPAANLTIFINDQPLTSSETQLFQTDSGFQWTAAHAVAYLTPEMFPGRRLRLSCEATVHKLYSEVATALFFTPVDPRHEKITLPNGSGVSRPTCIVIVLLLLISRAWTFFEEEMYFEEPSEDVEEQDELLRSLV